MESARLRIGLIVNPLAGLGGSVALKGSDHGAAREALSRGAEAQAMARATRALERMGEAAGRVEWCTWGGAMGEQSLRDAGLEARVLGAAGKETRPEDTVTAARALRDAGVDLLVFAGGDGTARDIATAVGHALPVLGIPAGCKMHSGVYAVNPEAAGQLLAELARGELVNIGEAEVRDIDEEAFRQGRVRASTFATLRVPAEGRFLQRVKCGGRELEELVLTEVAAEVIDGMEDGHWYLMGSGSTVDVIMEQLGLENTLLGVDLVRDGERVGADLTAAQILEYLSDGAPAHAVITVIGGQGHLFGRGNQQFSPQVIRRIGRENLIVVATRTKLKELEGRPLLVDTGDPELDRELCGLIPVVTGYEDEVLYRVSTQAD